MSECFERRLNARRKQGPSPYERLRGPNTGSWEKTNIPNRRDQSHKLGYSDPNRFRPKDNVQR